MATELWRASNPHTGTECILHTSNWENHAERRSLIVGHEDSARQTAEDPDFALQDANGVLFKYRRGFLAGAHRALWLVVVEASDADGVCTVRTVYFSDRIRNYPVVYSRRPPIGRARNGRR